VERELYAELGELAAEFTAEARRHTGDDRIELERCAAQVRLIRHLYWTGATSVLTALDWLNAGRTILGSSQAWRLQ
jgi:hypothetical protein